MKNASFWLRFALSHLLVIAVGIGCQPSSPSLEEIDALANEQLASRDDSLRAGGGRRFKNYDLAAHQTLSRVIYYIKEHYVDPSRVFPKEMFVAAVEEIEKSVPEVLVDARDHSVAVTVGDQEREFRIDNLDQPWEVAMALRDVFGFLQDKVAEGTELRDIEYAAINGLLSTLDPHSVLLRPESFDDVRMSTKGEFGGLGIVISIRDSRLTVISPIVDTPAYRAGIKAQDKIVKIGEESTVNMSTEDAVTRLRGKPGTKIDIWILRSGWDEPRLFRLQRAIIKIESVTSELLADGVGYIRIKNFQGNTYDDMVSQLDGLRAKLGGELKGLVLDLRNNPGGLLDQAVAIADHFIASGPLVITVGEGRKKREERSASYIGSETQYPMAVLVNGGSASASEIVSGAIKNLDRGIVVGQKTFGKGSVQVLYDFKDRSALKLTIAQYLTPGDVSIQSVGIQPDIVVNPIMIKEEMVRAFEPNRSPREEDLDHHLKKFDRANTEAQKAAFTIDHVQNDEVEDKDPEPDELADQFRTDYEIDLAQKLLSTSKGTRPQMLDSSKLVLEDEIQKQGVLTAEAFEKLGINWEAKSASPSSPLSVSSTIVVKPKTGKKVFAGASVDVIATVTNRSQNTMSRVYGLSKSENGFFDRLEFPFGTLKPGETKQWSVERKLPLALSERADLVEFEVHSDTNIEEQGSSTIAEISAETPPLLTYSYHFDDRKGGNGDGLIQVGEQVDFIIDVKNLGKTAAKDAFVTVRNSGGSEVFLKVGRASLGEIAAGKSKRASLNFEVKGNTGVSAAKLQLSVWDGEFATGFSDELEIAFGEAKQIQKVRGVVESKVDVTVYSGASAATNPIGTLKSGARVRATMKTGGFTRVVLGKDAFGFIDSNALKSAKKLRKKLGFKRQPGQEPPRIGLSLPALITEDSALNLEIQVSDRDSLRDMYIFVNEQKVFFTKLGDAVRGKDGETVVLRPKIPLEEGTNEIGLVVRESDTLMGRRSFAIYRKPIKLGTAKPAELRSQ
ncbi:MAG: MXAN_5808 family serine peptidase [Myxococcota bacterium]|nr:MXAN_5808 family serine peptidase [Myxococcota bacterium]